MPLLIQLTHVGITVCAYFSTSFSASMLYACLRSYDARIAQRGHADMSIPREDIAGALALMQV